MKSRDFITLISIPSLYIIPVLWSTRHLFFRLFTDYDSNLPIYYFLVDSIRNGVLPVTNPHLGLGISTIGDPLSAFFNPFFSLPLLLWGIPTGIRVVFWLSVVSSSVSMYYFLNSIKVSTYTRLWGALLYSLSGALAAAIAAGHIEKILAYPLLPFLFTIGLKKHWTLRDGIGNALGFALLFYSGAIYILWFTFILVSLMRMYYLIQRVPLRITPFLSSLGVFFLLASPRLYSFLVDVLPVYSRVIEQPLRGSLQLPFFILPFVIPWGVEFYDRPTLQRLIGFYYNWYEYYAFISPLPFIFLYKLRSIWSKQKISILVLVILAAGLYFSIRYPYSPWFWIYQITKSWWIFRVPQRIVLPTLPIIIALLCSCADEVYEKNKLLTIAITIGALVWCGLANQPKIATTFESIPESKKEIIEHLVREDHSHFYVLNLMCCSQVLLTKANISVVNYYYGWKRKDSPEYISDNNFSALANSRPSYILTENTDQDFSQYNYYSFIEKDRLKIWKTDTPNLFPRE